MNADNFRDFGKAAIDMIASYTEGLREREVLPSVDPGYLQHMLPNEIPKQGENWQQILEDVERVILPGVTHWQSPRFHAYYPTSTSYPSVIGELLSSGLGIIGFSWITSPACTELEVVVMDWLGKLIGLPEQFLNSSESPGGGVIQGSASEATFLCLLAAKERMLRKVKERNSNCDEGLIKGKMVAYTSDQANSSVEKAGLLASMTMRLLDSDEEGCLNGATLRNAIQQDLRIGLIPTYVCATLGTTGTCSFDLIEEIGPVCREFDIWLHIDAAYAGSACVCPEYRNMLRGVDLADSFNFNPHKWLLVNFDCSALWVKDAGWLVDAFNVDRIYLQHHKQGNSFAPDYREYSADQPLWAVHKFRITVSKLELGVLYLVLFQHWQIPLGRRFRALKLWITLRCYGEEGLQAHIRNQISLAKQFEKLVRSDPRFEVLSKSMGLVCFRIKGQCEKNQELLNLLTSRKKIYLVAGKFRGELCLRFVVCSRMTDLHDIFFAWEEIKSQADSLFQFQLESQKSTIAWIGMNNENSTGQKQDILTEINSR